MSAAHYNIKRTLWDEPNSARIQLKHHQTRKILKFSGCKFWQPKLLLKIGLLPKTALLAGFCSEDQLIQTWDTLLVICEKVRKQRLAEKELHQMPSLPCFPFDPFSASTILVQRNRGTLNTSIHPKCQWHWPHTLAQIYHWSIFNEQHWLKFGVMHLWGLHQISDPRNLTVQCKSLCHLISRFPGSETLRQSDLWQIYLELVVVY